MPDAAQAVSRCLARTAVALAVVLLAVAPAWAQRTPGPTPDKPAFMPRYTFDFAGAALSSDDKAFSWDTHFGGEVEIVDYVVGRAAFLADYQAVLGSEFRPFDPNQGNYLLDLSGSVRVPRVVELVGVFHHVSRHLSDRPKRFPIAWNMLQARALRRFVVDGNTIDVRADIGKVVAESYVDYLWEGDLELVVRRPVTPYVGLYAKALGQTLGVDPVLRGRTRQDGGRIEGGFRFTGGKQGSVELYVGYEKMIDASLINFQPRQWAFAGFRVVGN